MNMPEDAGRKKWAVRAIRVAAILGALVAAALGSFGWFVNAFGIGSSCTDHFSCVSGSCAPCAAMRNWVIAGGIGEWVLVIAACMLLVVGRKRAKLRRTVALSTVVILPLSVAWYSISTLLAEHSF